MAKDKEGAVYDPNGVPYNYLIVIDAGSSGSRLHVYSYPDTSYTGITAIDTRDDDDGKETKEELESEEEKGQVETEQEKEEEEDEADEEGSKKSKSESKSDDSKDHAKADKESSDHPASSQISLPAVSKQGFKWVKKTKPGISSFAENPSKVGKKHLKDLLKYAEKIVPESQHHRTPVFLHATGGMRILDDSTQEDILANTCSYIKSKTDFFIPDCATHINVISGDVEGIFGWLSINYLAGGIQNPEAHDHGKGHSTYGLLEMGGASTQVAFVPNATEITEHSKDLYGVSLASLNGTGSREYSVSSTTFLGLGVNEIQREIIKSLGSSKENPCDPAGLEVSYNKDGRRIISKKDKEDDTDSEDEDDEEENKVYTKTVGTGKYDECQALLKPLVKDVKPTIGADFDFDIHHFIGVSEYWDTAHDGFQMGGKFDYGRLETKVKEFCETPWDSIQKKGKNDFKSLNQEELESLCLRASWILNMVDNGLGVPSTVTVGGGDSDSSSHNETLGDYLHPLQSVDEINGNKYTWTLGRAVLYASAEQSQGQAGILMKNSQTGHLLYGSESKRPAFDPNTVDSHKGGASHDDDHDDHDDDDYDWDDMLEHHSKRIWGSLLFLLILVVILYLLLGKVRRNQIWQSIKTRVQQYTGGGGRSQGSKYQPMGRNTDSNDNDLELGTIEEDGADAFSVTSDDEEESGRGRRH